MTTDNSLAAIGQALGSQYEVVRLLGRGGMASVYLARERALDRLVAVKVLPPDLSAEEGSRERFRREARTAANLSHPNIVPLYTFGEADTMLYFVMGYVRGESLGARLRREGRLPADDVRRILAELAHALHYAHGRGVVHRDVKPDNVLLDDETGRPMLTDFGIARAQASASTLTSVGTVVGTAHYMSPEQGAGDRTIDGRSDLYSLGVMGYEMLAGRVPFEGTALRDVLVQHAVKDPVALALVAPDVPRDVASVISRAMLKEPAARWPDGSEMALALGGDGAATDDDDAEMQISIRGSAPFYFGLLLTSATLAVAVLTMFLPGGRRIWMIAPGLFAVFPTLILGGVAIRERLGGRSWSDIRDRFMTPRPGWRWWWPRRWRRAGDVWDRLPAPLRRVKAMELLTIGLALPPCLVTFADFYSYAFSPEGLIPAANWIEPVIFSTLALCAAAYARHGWKPWARTTSLSAMQARRVLRAPLADRDFWRKPQHAALLSDTSPIAPRAPEPRAPKDFLFAISQLAERVTGEQHEIAAQSVAASRQLVSAIDALDAEIATLARDADPAELAAVELKLKALGDPVDGEPGSRRQIREVIAGQYTLLLRLREQSASAHDRRTRLADLLKTLWLQLANLRADAAAESLSAGASTQDIRALCSEIERNAAADAEIRALLE